MSGSRAVSFLVLVSLVAVQGFAVWVLGFFVPAAEQRAMELGGGRALPAAVVLLLDIGQAIAASPWLWIPLWALLVLGLGYALWRFRGRRWPGRFALRPTAPIAEQAGLDKPLAVFIDCPFAAP
jgi:hypothetical protein